MPIAAPSSSCPLCADDGASLWHNEELRVIDAGAAGHPGYTRVIWRAHVAEMTQLTPPERDRLMRVVWGVEQALRNTLAPDKINLAEFGNQVPHLHWHIIPRWRGDTHFPEAIWAARRRAPRNRKPDGMRRRPGCRTACRLITPRCARRSTPWRRTESRRTVARAVPLSVAPAQQYSRINPNHAIIPHRNIFASTFFAALRTVCQFAAQPGQSIPAAA